METVLGDKNYSFMRKGGKTVGFTEKKKEVAKKMNDPRSEVAKRNWDKVSPYFKGIIRGQEKHDKKVVKD